MAMKRGRERACRNRSFHLRIVSPVKSSISHVEISKCRVKLGEEADSLQALNCLSV